MKLLIHTYFLLTWLTIFILALSGCRSESESSHSATTDTSAPVTPTTITTAIDLSPWQQANINWRQFEGTMLSVLAGGQLVFTAVRPYLPVFEQLTGIRVGYQAVEQMEMRNKREMDLASGSAIYDIIPIGVTYLGEAYLNGWLEILDPYITDTMLTDANWYDFVDISPNSLILCQKEGHLLSVPFDFSAAIFFYRKDLFDKYQISLPETYEEVVAMKHRLQRALEADGMAGVYAFTTRTRAGAGLNTWTVIPAIRAYGGKIFNEQWQPIFNSPSAIKALEVYRDMVTGYGSPPGSKNLHFNEIRALFKEGKLASTISASHFFNEMDSADKSAIWDRWDATLIPKGPVARETSPWAWAFAINAASKNKKAAWLFIQWLSSKPTARLLKTDGGAPARRSVWESDYYAKLNAPGLIRSVKWVLDTATPSKMQLGLPEFPQAGFAASKAFSEIFYGAPVQPTLDKAVIQVEKIMAEGPTRQALNQKE